MGLLFVLFFFGGAGFFLLDLFYSSRRVGASALRDLRVLPVTSIADVTRGRIKLCGKAGGLSAIASLINQAPLIALRRTLVSESGSAASILFVKPPLISWRTEPQMTSRFPFALLPIFSIAAMASGMLGCVYVLATGIPLEREGVYGMSCVCCLIVVGGWFARPKTTRSLGG